ncbi:MULTISPECIES: hypothetical protein [unclassified Mucilaginibacter]|uniref:hypothetical protein n=1 Tax=unclassified Mucilaginibacter TaxID=2617802 RepID=UPI0009699B9D|nr:MULTISPECIES: hypothetical protein [unclassified Mucilaginibacter]OJW16848.1 MAG: hypothetical protein BGO48_10340 [Mucilaginibacter sp. 44-25]PLW89735.1 MAG: hypothetical protein C0154_10020 [Mucilaginibacter sp.]HEK19897.1 hypothetical protein [Bacteroidota bacterium]
MKTNVIFSTRPTLKTKGFSTHHIDIFNLILLGKTNREINQALGYTKRSHAVVDHSRRVMYKLLALEELGRKDHHDRVVYPRNYQFWWKKLLDKHMGILLSVAIAPGFYDDRE